MLEFSSANAAIFISVFAAIFASIAGVIALMGGRRSHYDAHLQAVLLDATRKSMEADMRAMYDSLYRDKERWNEVNHLVIDSLRKSPDVKDSEKSGLVVDPERYLSSLGIGKKDWTIDQRSVFILTPLSDAEQKVTNIIKFACSEVGLRASRGDEENITGPILPSIIKAILQARLIIANINGRNPNVMYELGIAQALGKDVIVISQKYGDEPPFDVRQQRLVLYDSYKDLSNKLKISISQIGLGIQMNG